MAEQFPIGEFIHHSDDPHVDSRVTGASHVDGQDFTHVEALFPQGADREELREVVAEVHDVSPDDVYIEGTDDAKLRSRRGHATASFMRWRSKWEPHAQKGNPNLN